MPARLLPRRSHRAHPVAALVAFVAACAHPAHVSHTPVDVVLAPAALRAPGDFAALTDPAVRSAALWSEASRVLLHPRCVNCHPSDDSPRQGDAHAFHDPPVVRGEHDQGVAAMQCSSCHQDHNLPLARVPGAPHWQLAPRSMAWFGRSPAALCEQVKDPARNGGRSLEQVYTHMAHDDLVGWGWHPGAGRQPAPGSQAQLGALIRAWIDTGARCPTEEPAR